MTRRGNSAGALASLIAACIYAVALLMSLVTGVGVYRQVEERVEQAERQRLGLNYITEKIHSADSQGCIYVDRFGEQDPVQALFLLTDIDGVTYDTVLYVYDGYLCELFCPDHAGLGPEDGMPITAAQQLQISQDGRLLDLAYTDAAGVCSDARIYLRCETPPQS